MKKQLVVILAIFIPLLLIGTGAWAYFTYFTPQAQAKHIAEQVMQAASTQQQEAFKSHGAPSGSNSFYNVVGQRNYRLSTTAQEGDVFYFLYALTDDISPRLARVGVTNGTVTSLSTGDKLADLPRNDPKQTSSENTGAFCLAKSDLQYLDTTNLYAKTFRGATMIFADDTNTVYSGEENAHSLLDRMANFYQKTKSKDYSFLIRGYLAASPTTLEERKQIIQNRVTKIQQDLRTRGIPEDRIDIGEPIAYPIDQPTDGQNERYVIIDVTNSCAK